MLVLDIARYKSIVTGNATFFGTAQPEERRIQVWHDG
jgi:hypothetical protein